jgi:hypothetical protein
LVGREERSGYGRELCFLNLCFGAWV